MGAKMTVGPGLHAARLGLSRGLIEFRQQTTNVQDVSATLVGTLVYVVVLVFQKDSTLAGTSLPLALATLPGLVALTIASSAVLDVAGLLSVQREDGTLLRAKVIPHGMTGYLVARIVSVSLNILAGVFLMLFAGLIVIPDLARTASDGWLTLVPVCLLGLVATLPWGAVIGAVARTPMAVSMLGLFPIIAITAVSGIFYPITALPGWMQSIGQVFPVYWLGLGVRASLLPDAAVAAELGRSWRTVETFGVLGLWAVLGLVVAPVVLRRMVRRESGTDLRARRDRAMQEYA